MGSVRGIKRREVFRTGAGLIALGVCAGLPGAGYSLLASSTVPIPSSPMLLSRRLSRGLRDGKAIVVNRTWEVTFEPQARGFSVMGKQTGVSVDAPPALERLSNIERARSTSGMFPILLSQDGLIVASGPSTSKESVKTAIGEAEKIIAQRTSNAATLADQRRFLAQLQRSGSSILNGLPGDLFFPSTTPFRETKKLVLPEGGSGEFEVSWEASVQEGTPWLQSASRKITTRTNESQRVSSEIWTMKPN